MYRYIQQLGNQLELDTLNLKIQPPEMLFGKNLLRIERGSFFYEFNAIDCLNMVEDTPESCDRIKVSCAKTWKEKRYDKNHLRISSCFIFTLILTVSNLQCI